MAPSPVRYRPMASEESERVCQLVSRTFMRDVAPYFSPAGAERYLTEIDADAMARRLGADHHAILAVSGRNETPAGVIEIREYRHIRMLFVDGPFQRRGIARALMDRAVARCRARRRALVEISVNASPNAVAAYIRMGFRPTDGEREIEGIRFTPMALRLNK